MDFADVVRARLGGFTGHFAISWALVNWKVWFWIFTGDHAADTRIAGVTKYLSEHGICGALLAGPVVLAGVFAFGVWPASQWLTGFSEVLGRTAREKANGRSLLTMGESTALRKEILKLQHEVLVACSASSHSIELLSKKANDLIKQSGGQIDPGFLESQLGGEPLGRVNIRILLAHGRIRYADGKGAEFAIRDVPLQVG